MVLQPQSNDQSPAHLLIVSDDEATGLLRSLLEPHYHVTVTTSGQDALRRLAENSFDLVVSDINAPHLDGFQMLAAIRETPEIADTPVILVSGRDDSDSVVRSLEMGANDYLTKPIDRRVALARIRTQITLKRLLDSQKRIIDELKSIQLMRDRFFHIASHELKNPMNNIRMAHFLLREMVSEDPSADVLLDNIEIALDTMQDIVSDFLDMAAIQNQAIDLDLREVLVEDALWDVMIQFNVSAQKKQIVLKVEDAAGRVWADLRRLVQAISNLVSNAIKYSPRDSVVTLSTEQRGDTVRILIRDQGPGIPETERDRLFSEFGKLSTKPTDGEGRTGLGLWIVKQLIAMQNGVVGAEFPASGGSVFWIDLPAVEAAPGSVPADRLNQSEMRA
ncbi:MAG TPA: hybrid sensor histidine kinase/response regulator [Spirillospora sp.]|nr:hybrid sensor histidine kinase/response regulator [Spirillospora sp.]